MVHGGEEAPLCVLMCTGLTVKKPLLWASGCWYVAFAGGRRETSWPFANSPRNEKIVFFLPVYIYILGSAHTTFGEQVAPLRAGLQGLSARTSANSPLPKWSPWTEKPRASAKNAEQTARSLHSEPLLRCPVTSCVVSCMSLERFVSGVSRHVCRTPPTFLSPLLDAAFARAATYWSSLCCPRPNFPLFGALACCSIASGSSSGTGWNCFRFSRQNRSNCLWAGGTFSTQLSYHVFRPRCPTFASSRIFVYITCATPTSTNVPATGGDHFVNADQPFFLVKSISFQVSRSIPRRGGDTNFPAPWPNFFNDAPWHGTPRY